MYFREDGVNAFGSEEMKTLNVKGNEIIVDDDDYSTVMNYTWRITGSGYVESQIRIDGEKRPLLMHRLINKTPEGYETDHINHNKFDNRKCNLRTVSQRTNQLNSSINTKSGCRGIYTDVRDGKWRARTKINGKTHHIGTFDKKEEAEQAYFSFCKQIEVV